MLTKIQNKSIQSFKKALGKASNTDLPTDITKYINSNIKVDPYQILSKLYNKQKVVLNNKSSNNLLKSYKALASLGLIQFTRDSNFRVQVKLTKLGQLVAKKLSLINLTKLSNDIENDDNKSVLGTFVSICISPVSFILLLFILLAFSISIFLFGISVIFINVTIGVVSYEISKKEDMLMDKKPKAEDYDKLPVKNLNKVLKKTLNRHDYLIEKHKLEEFINNNNY